MQKFYTFCIRFLQISSLILFGILAVISFLWTASIEEPYTYVIRLKFENPLMNLLFFICYLGILFMIGNFFARRKRGNLLCLGFTCLWIFGVSLLWIYFSKNGPIADGASVYYAAKQFAGGDYSAVSYKGSYFSVYPFQYGLAFFYEMIFRLVGNDNFHILQGINALFLVFCALSQYHLCGRFFREKEAQIYTLLLTGSCAPFLMYSSFIYGEIPSITFSLFGTWMLLAFLDGPCQVSDQSDSLAKKSTEKSAVLRALCGILALFSISASVLVRKNSLVFIIALGITALLWLMYNRHTISAKKLALHAVSFILLFSLSLSILPLVQNRYAAITGEPVNSGVPAASYLAMGLSETEVGPGFYDGSNFKTFTEDADYDTDAAAKIAWASYRERLTYFMDNPVFSLQFFFRKFCAEWIDTGWAVFPATYNSYGERFPLAESLFSGALYEPLKFYVNHHRTILYLMAALGLWGLFYRKKDDDAFSYLFPLTAFGGAILFLAWETSGRYILPYAIFIFPHAGYGVHLFFARIQNFFAAKRG